MIMTQNDKDLKELLLKDLCARLPYGVKVKTNNIHILRLGTHTRVGEYVTDVIEPCKPYLFPLSSMTEEQREEFLNIQTEERQILLNALIEYKSGKYDKIPIIAPYKQIEWLNKNHFDYRNLINKNLAIDCTNLNIY